VSGPGSPSPFSIGIEWASRIVALGFLFSVPPIAGYFVDRWLGSNPVGIMAGMISGFVIGMMQLLQIARNSSKTG
jgi:F0F1-type ATP synthase assembly protein I